MLLLCQWKVKLIATGSIRSAFSVFLVLLSTMAALFKGSETSLVLDHNMESGGLKRTRCTKRPFIILTIIFIIVVIIVGVVVWKVTKDSYEEVSDGSVSEVKDSPGTTGSSGGGDKHATTTQRPYTEEEIQAKPWLSLRMRRDVLPVHYDITMFPDFYDNGTEFYGNETIELEVLRPTKFILIHIHPDYITVTRTAVLDSENGDPIAVSRTFVYRENEFYVIELSDVIDKPVSVSLQFEGSLIKGIEGIYKSTYLNTKTGENRHIVSSKFEPTFARRAFPCFDEPNIKANFTVTLVHRPDYVALSNMPVVQSVAWSNDLNATRFQRSVKMSTYLLCFTVCDFTFLETTSARGIPIRVYAAPDKLDQAHYALGVANTSMNLYERLFKENYPLPKQDLIAIPDFVSGAMEHWGLISFRESRLLYDENKTSLAGQESMTHTVTHEMSHMWFGNLVTMDWWNDLWLNEGFASYMEYLGADEQQPGWDMLTKFLIHDMFYVMDQDSAVSSHPIIVDVENPGQITSVFDAISYSKGASVIRMLNTILGDESFFRGVALYLKEHKWGNARTDDLWKALSQEAPGHDVKHIMDTWTLQEGFPYISVSVDTDDQGMTTVTANQSRFLLNMETPFDVSESPFRYKWYVQLDYNTEEGTSGVEVMDMTDVTFRKDLGLSSSDQKFIKFNVDHKHFYRVLYPDAMWTAFSEHLRTTSAEQYRLSTSDRAGLLGDSFKLASAGLVSYRVPLGMMKYLGKEREYVPWSVANSQGMSYIKKMLRFDPQYGLWKKFLTSKLTPVIGSLEYIDNETNVHDDSYHSQRQLRALISSLACSMGEEVTVQSLVQQFLAWIDDPDVAPLTHMRSLVYNCGMANAGTDAIWETVWNRYLKEPSPTEKEQLASSLASIRKPHLIARLLDRAQREDGIKSQDFFTVVRRVGANSAARDIVWDWARVNYQEFVDRFTINHRYFGRMIYYMVRDYNTELRLREVQALFDAFPEAGASERYRRMAVESIQTNIDWMAKYRPQVLEWLHQENQ